MPKFASYTALTQGQVDPLLDYLVISDAGATTKKVCPSVLLMTGISGTTGGLKQYLYEATANITAASSIAITLSIPASTRILGCQLRVDSALAGGELWDAAYSGGSTAAICSAQTVAANTKVNSFTTDITTDTTNIAITKNGGGNFTAQGTIRAIVYAEVFTAMGSL